MKNIKISEDTHSAIKQYCNDNGLKISVFIDRLCKKWISEHVERNHKEVKKRSNG